MSDGAFPTVGVVWRVESSCTGRLAIRVSRTARCSAAKTRPSSLIRTSVFEGWTLTSTSVYGTSTLTRAMGKAPLHQEASIRLVQGERQASVLHPATVYVDRHVVPIGSRERGPADQTADPYGTVLPTGRLDIQHRLCHLGPVHGRRGLAKTARAVRHKQRPCLPR